MKQWMVAAIVALTASASFAQGPGPGGPPPGGMGPGMGPGMGFGMGRQFDPIQMRIGWMEQTLGLTADQKTKITELLRAEQQEIQKIQEATQKKIASVLTPEQARQMEEATQQMRRMMQGMGRPGGDVMFMLRDLNLTADQQEKVRRIMENQRTKVEALNANQDMDPQARRAQMEKLRTDTFAEIRTVLDAEQQKKFDEIVANTRNRQQQGMRQGGGQQGGQGAGANRPNRPGNRAGNRAGNRTGN